MVIGGVGGSGTRLVTRLLQALGINFDGSLNDSLDNLWFTLLFVRRTILLKSDSELAALAWLFNNAMRGGQAVPETLLPMLDEAARHDRGPALRRDVLQAARDSLLGARAPAAEAAAWGWKQPNSQVMVPQLRRCFPGMKYIYVVRNGLDMALSYNQNQLMYFWGDLMLEGDTAPTPANSLRYWVASYRRILDARAAAPDAIYILDYDQLCREPLPALETLADFLQVAGADLKGVAAEVIVPATTGRHRAVQMSQFHPADLQFVRDMGFEVPA